MSISSRITRSLVIEPFNDAEFPDIAVFCGTGNRGQLGDGGKIIVLDFRFGDEADEGDLGRNGRRGSR
jgi:hypothetical protein